MGKNSDSISASEELFVVKRERLLPEMYRFRKLKRGVVIFCLSGWADIAIDLKRCRVSKNSQVILLPGTVLRVENLSSDLEIFSFDFSVAMLREASLHIEPMFFGFIKENPCYTLTEENMDMVKGFVCTSRAIYADRNNRFRSQIAKNCLQNFIYDVYDKCFRNFTEPQIKGKRKGDRIFNDFAGMVREHCALRREVGFYAEKLCISVKYLSDICRSVTGHSAKNIIDDFVVLEIKVLLELSELSVQEIADRLEFPDQSYLGRYFKRHEGISPKEFRKRYS